MEKTFTFDRIVQLAERLATFAHDEGPRAARLLRSAANLVGANSSAPGSGRMAGAFAAGALVGAAAGVAFAPASGPELRKRAGAALRTALKGNPAAERLVNAILGATPDAAAPAQPGPVAAAPAAVVDGNSNGKRAERARPSTRLPGTAG